MENRIKNKTETLVKKSIVWEKYIDPLNPSPSDLDYFNEEHDEHVFGVSKNKIISTPMGIISVLDTTLASHYIDFWIMRTNFDITYNTLGIIKNVRGVETVEIFTRYMARVGFPKSGLFDIQKIKKDIENSIMQADIESKVGKLTGFKDDIIEKIRNIITGLYEKNVFWSMLVLPNGNVNIVSSKTNDNQYNIKKQLLNETQILAGGVLIDSGS